MRIHLFHRTLKLALAAIFMGAMSAITTAGSLTRECVIRDLQTLMLIEERESASSISTEELSDAVVTMMRAQMACYEGRVADALALYEDISRRFTSDTNVFGRHR